MRRATAVIVRLGDLVDVLGRVVCETPSRTRAALASRRSRVAAAGAGGLVLVLYLMAVGDIAVVSLRGSSAAFARVPSAQLVADWPDKLLATRGAFLFEPIAAVYPLPQLALFLSPGKLVLAGVLATLFGLNVAVAVHAVSHAKSCRRNVYGRLASVLPAFLTGMVCCVPSFVLLLGASTAAAVLPVLAPIRAFLFPLAVTIMAVTLAWGAQRTVSPADR